jgi:hypothetical protein
MANSNLGDARRGRNDEFYTQYHYIEKEMNAYLDYDPDVFRSKSVLLPCDDPEWSNFTRYFAQNFERLGLKKLVSTSFAPNSKPQELNLQPTLFELESPQFDRAKTASNGKIFTLSRDTTGDDVVNVDDLEWDYLVGDGDFQSPEITKLRDEADVIVTNPPFSLFRKFLPWITEASKKFVVIGNMNAITYKEVFPLIQNDQLWLGATNFNEGMYFRVPSNFEYSSTYKFEREQNGHKVSRVPGIAWFTNIDHGRRHQPLPLMTEADNIKFSKHKEVRGVGYRKYDNYDALEVSFTDSIPSDFEGVMGVPITFLDKYDPNQFEIIGTMAQSDPNYPFRTKWYSAKDQQDAYFRRFGVEGSIPMNMSGVIDDVKVYQRILIRHRKARNED